MLLTKKKKKMKKEQKEKEDKFYEFCMKHHTCNGCPRETICFPEENKKRRKNENYKRDDRGRR